MQRLGKKINLSDSQSAGGANIKVVMRIFYFSLIFTIVAFGVSVKKLNQFKSEVQGLSILDGRVSFANSPQDFYTATILRSFDSDLNWLPGEQTGTATQPSVQGQSALLVDLDSGKVLYEKYAHKRMKIASITKVMTAIVALEHKNLDDKIYISRYAAYIGEDTMYLTTGEVYTLRELLYGLLLNSGNDAAYAIAEGTAGDWNTFVRWMNLKAQELGLNDTRFYDPSGLDDNTYSTAFDLVKLSRYAMKNPDFAEIVNTKEMEISADTHKTLMLQNATNLIGSYPGVSGIKTGYTEEAGLCLLSYATNGGHRLAGVVLNSTDRKGDMILMLDHGFGTLGVTVEHHLLD
jgi:serine-type D-Ala-D-Ala carboxypeptidase (penicillin-binding protein 5/6)